MGRKLTAEEKQARADARAHLEALAAEEQDRRHQAKRFEWDRTGARLTREEFEAGEPCRGCGRALRGDTRPSLPCRNDMTELDRADDEQDKIEFTRLHPDCNEVRWTVGGRTSHCGLCCPFPPMSRSQVEIIRTIFAQPVKEHEQDTWNLGLTCGHNVSRTQHQSNRSWTTAVVDCTECEARRGVVKSERGQKPKTLSGPASDRAAAREKDTAAAEAAIKQLKSDLRAAEKHLKELRA